MEVTIDWGALISGLILAILVWGGRGLFTRVDKISEGQAKLNTKVVSLKTWADAHEKQDDERHETVTGDIKTLFQKTS